MSGRSGDNPAAPRGCWIVDRRISLGLILAILLQVVAMTTWLTRLETRVTALEETDARQDVELRRMQDLAADIEGMRTDISWIRASLGRSGFAACGFAGHGCAVQGRP